MQKGKFILETLVALILGMVIAKLIVPMFLILGHVPSESMVPTLNVGDKLICTNVFWHNLEYGDIVVFKPNKELHDDDSLWIKRLIGLPGDKIKIEHGKVFRNGTELDESYIQGNLDYNGSFVVPEDRYFVLGDNREESLDARFWENPFINVKQIKYVANLRVFPFTEIENFTPKDINTK